MLLYEVKFAPIKVQSAKFAPVRVLVCNRISVHPSECIPAPIIFAPLGYRFAPFRVQKYFCDCKHEYLVFKRAPLSEKVQVCSPKVQLLWHYRVQTCVKCQPINQCINVHFACTIEIIWYVIIANRQWENRKWSWFLQIKLIILNYWALVKCQLIYQYTIFKILTYLKYRKAFSISKCYPSSQTEKMGEIKGYKDSHSWRVWLETVDR